VKHLYCIFSPTDYICGHPEIQHGGATATIIDQNMGYLASLYSHELVATAKLNVEYKRPIRKNQYYVLEVEV
jgi:acyl-coenzyme A thioesterase PaaI-like protein